ncbi:MAG: TrmB family transcriptional regulator [Clostridiales bacterium]|nr:TrmB family transcriptional regulator [Clostridiales bacterium]
MDAAELLTHFGLTRLEAAVYMAMCREGSLTGYEAAKLTGISRSNTYTILAGLVEKGAACLMEGAAAHYTAVPPQEFSGNILRRLQEDRALLLECLPSRCREAEGYITVQGEKHIMYKMQNMLSGAKERVYLSVSREIAARVLPELQNGVSRGIKVVVIANEPFTLPGAVVYHAEKEQNQIRLIADSASVLTGDLNDGENSSCLYSRKKNLVDLFKESLKNEIKLIELTERNRQT